MKKNIVNSFIKALYLIFLSSLVFLLISSVAFNGETDALLILVNSIIWILAVFFILCFFRFFFSKDASLTSLAPLIFLPFLPLLHDGLILFGKCYSTFSFNYRILIIVSFALLFLIIPIGANIFFYYKKRKKNQEALQECESILSERTDLFNTLKNYMNNNSYVGAFFINGSWGSGKTFYFKKYLSYFLLQNNKNKAAYISLNGLETLEELQEKLFWSNHPRSYAFFESKVGRTIETVLRKIGFTLKEVRHDKLNNQLIIFDDLERSSIQTIKLFGFFDAVLSAKTKVILIGNEVEIKDPLNPNEYDNNRLISVIALSNKDRGDDVNKTIVENRMKLIGSSRYYERIKEKVICLSYHFNFNFSIFKDHIINNYTSIHKILMNNISTIESIIKKLKCSNLRVCEISLVYFDEINKTIDEILQKNKEMNNDKEFIAYLKKECLLYVFYCVIKDRIPNVHNNEIDKTFDLETYSSIYGIRVAFKAIKDNISTLKLNKKDFSKEIENEFSDFKESKDDRLPESMIHLFNKHWEYLSDQEVINNVNKMFDDFYNKLVPINKIYFVYHYAYIYTKYYGFRCDYTLKNILDETLKQIEKSNYKKLIKFKEKVFDEHFFLEQFPPNERPGLKQIIDKMMLMCTKLQDESLNNNLSINIGEILKNIEKYSNQAIERKAFLSSINIEILNEIIKKGTNTDIVNFREILDGVYNFSNIKDFFEADIEAVQSLTVAVSQYANSLKKLPNINIKKKNLERLIDDLNSISKRLT